MLLRPRKQSRGWLARFFDGVNRGLERTTRGYVSLSHGLIRKPLIGIATLLLFAVAAGWLGKRLPSSFLPEEDYGYFLMNIQLPPAASLERTDAVTRKVDAMLKQTEGVGNFNTIVGFSLIDARHGEQQRLLLRAAEAVGRRVKVRALQARAIVDRLNGQLAESSP